MVTHCKNEAEYPGRWRSRPWRKLLPTRQWQLLRRIYYGWQIRTGCFNSDEAEYYVLHQFVSPDDCVLDVGANVGRYTLKLSELVGPDGHVFAFEPVPETFEILASNVQRTAYANITLFNVAVSDETGMSELVVPTKETGLAAHYFARLAGPGETGNGCRAFCTAIDTLQLPSRVSLAKIDVEGHEARVLAGMRQLIERDRPTLIVEGDSAEVDMVLKPFGYCSRSLKGSHNRIFSVPAHKLQFQAIG